MNLNDIIKRNETLSGLPYIYVITVLIELEQMGLLEGKNDTSRNVD